MTHVRNVFTTCLNQNSIILLHKKKYKNHFNSIIYTFYFVLYRLIFKKCCEKTRKISFDLKNNK